MGTLPAWKSAAAGTLTTTVSSVAFVTGAGCPPICTAPTFSRLAPVRVTVPPETLPAAGWMEDTTDAAGDGATACATAFVMGDGSPAHAANERVADAATAVTARMRRVRLKGLIRLSKQVRRGTGRPL